MNQTYLYKGGEKLAYALETFNVDVAGKTVADLGCNVGGFTDCLLKKGALKVLSVDTGYGILAWKLRIDDRVEVFERTNAMHWVPECPLDGAVIDVAWTKQEKIIPHAFEIVSTGGFIVSLFKPQYEADKKDLKKGVLPEELVEPLVEATCTKLADLGFPVSMQIRSALKGGKKGKGNSEFLFLFDV